MENVYLWHDYGESWVRRTPSLEGGFERRVVVYHVSREGKKGPRAGLSASCTHVGDKPTQAFVFGPEHKGKFFLVENATMGNGGTTHRYLVFVGDKAPRLRRGLNIKCGLHLGRV